MMSFMFWTCLQFAIQV